MTPEEPNRTIGIKNPHTGKVQIHRMDLQQFDGQFIAVAYGYGVIGAGVTELDARNALRAKLEAYLAKLAQDRTEDD